jgi:hypothetical protein
MKVQRASTAERGLSLGKPLLCCLKYESLPKFGVMKRKAVLSEGALTGKEIYNEKK